MKRSIDLPVTLTAAILLRLGRILTGIAGFGEVSREVSLMLSGTVSEAGMIAVSELVGASHCLSISN